MMDEKNQINILIVDDKPENIYSLKSLLLDENYMFFTSTSGKGALNIAIKEEIHLILLDVQMPEMDGYEVARLLKMNSKTEKIPVIFITAINHGIEHAVKGFIAGAADYIFKPVVPEILKAKVSLFIKLYRKEQELAEINQLLMARNKDLQNAHKKLQDVNDELESRVEDRTNELKEINKDLQRINKVLDNFLNVSAHDLRGPLSNLTMALKLFRKADDEQMRERLLKGIDDSLVRIDLTIRGIIEMVEVQERSDNIVQKINLDELLDRVKLDYMLQIEENNAIIISEFSQAPEIDFIAPYLESIFRNLLSNSLKYRSDNRDPVIEISSFMENKQLHLIFKDNCMGIDLNKYGNALFKPFSRINTKTTDGKGIGLHLLKNIVEMNGGKIEVESTYHSGTTFKLMLQPYSIKHTNKEVHASEGHSLSN
jgi:two-component system, sensor histidine kinase and response regulator